MEKILTFLFVIGLVLSPVKAQDIEAGILFHGVSLFSLLSLFIYFSQASMLYLTQQKEILG